MQLYLIATPTQQRTLPRMRCAFAHVAYRLGAESSLLRQNIPVGLQEGLLSISDVDAPQIDDCEALCAAVLRECQRRRYEGVLLDFESPPSANLQRAVHALDAALWGRKLPLYLPEGYTGDHAITLVGTAVSGGSFAQHLRERWDAHQGRIALDLERVHMDFRLPATTGEGTPLTRQQVAQLRKEHNPGVFFSQELCCRYFTYQSDGETHFVLFDDSETLHQKIRQGTALGVTTGFFVCNEVEDLLPGLLQLKK